VGGDFQRTLGGLEQESGPGTYDPDNEGYFVILEPGDNPRNLDIVGLNPAEKGLLGSWPEFVDLINLDEMSVYQVLILYNNECVMTLYLQAGVWDEEIEQWLEKHVHHNRE